MLIPYRAKNPPDAFPYMTVSLMVINTLVFALTSNGWTVHDSAVERFAVSHTNLSPWTLLTAMFLHGSLLHLAGNMLFLWIFGAAIEGRLKPLRYLAVYLGAGAIGSLLSDFVTGLINPDAFNLGASGAIMGLAGAYLYLFPYAPIRIAWFLWLGLLPRGGVTDWQARWVVLYFLGLDVFNGIIMGGGDGVGHFAHLGGAGAGFLFVWLLKMPRDSEDISEVQASLSDMRDVKLLTLYELDSLMQRPTEDVRLILAYCRQSLIAPMGASEAKCLWALRQYGNLLMERAEPETLAHVLLPLTQPHACQVPSVYFLRLGSRLEKAMAYETAVRIYRRLCEVHPASADADSSHLRVGRIMEQFYGDKQQAHFCYSEILKQNPQGPLSLEARQALRRLGLPAVPEVRS